MVFGFDAFRVDVRTETEARDCMISVGYGDLDNGCQDMERLIRFIENSDNEIERDEMMADWAYELSCYEAYCRRCEHCPVRYA